MAVQVLEFAVAVHRFIFLSDIAGSSRLAEAFAREYARALAQHNALIEQAVRSHGGSVYKHTGDGYVALFESAGACVACAAELAAELPGIAPLAEGEPLLVRIALHAGELQPAGTEYFGPALNRASRICQVCNPGQVLLSNAIAAALGKPLDGLLIFDLGEHHLRDLAEPEHLYQLDSECFARREFPPLATLNNRPNNLVMQPNAFIGRLKELEELAGLLHGGKRLITITAPGGYGKSRLAAQLCANLLHRFERGCFMAYLAPLRESLDVPLAIANALGFQFSGSRDPLVQLGDYLRAKELLLCLDNFEHVMDSAGMVKALLEAAPKLKLVITSREPLRLQGEHIYRLEPLPVAAIGEEQYSEAMRLFADRAALVKQGYALSADNAAQVQQFCKHMAGIPLAIELAAAWMDSFTLAELHDELTNQLELEARGSDLEPRHQSLKASLDWSWDLLGEKLQEMLMRLSVLRGGCFSEAASAVLVMKGMALRAALAKLCDKSWLYTREVDGQTRFFLRDALAHEYAFEKLRETGRAAVPGRRSHGGAAVSGGHPDAGRDARATEEMAGAAARPTEERSLYESAVSAHAAYFAALAEREGPQLDGAGIPDGGAAQMQALRTWHAELQNIDETLDTAIHRGELAWLIPIARHLQRFLHISSSYFNMRDRYRHLLRAAETLASAQLRLESLRGLGIAELNLGRLAEAMDALNQARQLATELGDRQGEANALGRLAISHYNQGDYTRANELQSQDLAIRREIGDKYGEANSLANLAIVHYIQGDYARAAELNSQALAIRREIGDKYGEANSLANLAIVHYIQGDYARAAELQSQALAIRCEIGDKYGEANSLGNLGNVHVSQGDYARAAELHSQALAINRELGNRHGEAASSGNLGSVHYKQGDYARAAELINQALAICREIGDRRGEAVSSGNLGNVHYLQGDYARAAELCSQTLVIRQKLGFKPWIAISCACTGAVLAALGRLHPAALALHGAVARAVEIDHEFEADDLLIIEPGLARLDSAVAAGKITVEQLAAWKAEGEAMSLDELAEFALGELAKLQDVIGPAEQQAAQ